MDKPGSMDGLPQLRDEVWRANLRLPEWGLVIGTHGNVSGFDRDGGLLVIKPSGVPYPELKAADLPVLTMDGRVSAGKLKPSVDWPHHLFLYHALPDIGGVAHTHSSFATAFAAAGLPVSCLTTGQADLFGGDIPVTPYVDNQGDHIGEIILKCRRPGCPAVILGGHGVFTFAENPEKAVWAARLTEYFAAIGLRAFLLGSAAGKVPVSLPEEEIRKWFSRYQDGRYGQEKEEDKI